MRFSKAQKLKWLREERYELYIKYRSLKSYLGKNDSVVRTVKGELDRARKAIKKLGVLR